MASHPLDIAAAEARARQLLDSRIASVRALVASRQTLSDLHQRVADAEREDVRLYAAALRDGWTAEELRTLGLTEPAKKERVRRRASQASAGAQRRSSDADQVTHPA